MSEAPSLPVEMVVHVASFIPEWRTLEVFLQALRPVNAIGQLRYLLHLRELGWYPDEWPHLRLEDVDEASRVHLEQAINYCSDIVVYNRVDPTWLCQYVSSTTPIQWVGDVNKFGRKWRKLWTRFRMTAVRNVSRHSCVNCSFLIDILPHSLFLVELSWKNCNQEISQAILQFAASSCTLRKLTVWTRTRQSSRHCKVTTSMANNLYQWIQSQPILFCEMGQYTWETPQLRDQITSALCGKSTLIEFGIYGTHVGTVLVGGYCRRRGDVLKLKFGSSRLLYQTEVTSDLSEYLRPFLDNLLGSKVKTLKLRGHEIFGSSFIWDLILPFLPLCHLEELDLKSNNITDRDVTRLAQCICEMKNLSKINLVQNYLRFDGKMAIIKAAPRSVKRIVFGASYLGGFEEVKTLASAKSIQLQ